MSSNKDKIIKQWIPQPCEVIDEGLSDNSNSNINDSSFFGQNDILPEERRDKIIEEALAKANKIKEDAYKEGYEKGLEQANKKFDDIYQKQSSQLSAVLSEIDEAKKCFEEEVEDKSLKLALCIAEKILNMKIENDDKVFVGLVRNALSMLDEDEKFILRLNCSEYERHFKDKHESFQKELQSDVPIAVVKDNSLNNGGFIVESKKSFIDASVGTQLKKISNSITQRDAQYHEAL